MFFDFKIGLNLMACVDFCKFWLA